MPICNICSCTDFIDFNGRKAIQCGCCCSLERHRLIRVVLEGLGFLDKNACYGEKRALHLAPEKVTFQYLESVFGTGYIASDMHPEKYPHAQVLRLALPEGFELFPDGYFDLILHNHVLEHIPGSFKEHLDEFVRLIKPGGYMVFTLPQVRMNCDTIEGGEYLSTDADRLKAHGQGDHYKTFGKDLYEHMGKIGGVFTTASIDGDLRDKIAAPADPVFVFEKA